ncbi:hypothetical protein SRRS_13050 [Sporomusa rhizae]|uniref:HD domain-containing phosphohydrolase n=1 Tax=Sporomusa rhizae TaxID=357999 RepID=UPI00352A8CFB
MISKLKLNKRSRSKLSQILLMTHSSLYYKVFTILFLVFSVTVLLLTYHLEKNIEVKHIDMVKNELVSIASIAAVTINGDAVEKLQNPEQQISDEYNSLQEQFRRMIEANSNIQDIYIMRKGENNNELYFVVNGNPAGIVEFNEAYSIENAPDMLSGFTKPSADREFTTDKWGVTLSGYAPVRNSQGQVVAIVGIDFDANHIKSGIYQRREFMITYSVMSMLIMLIISMVLAKRIVSRINKLKMTIENTLEKDYGIYLGIESHDEIQILASRVNNLIKRVTKEREKLFMSVITALINTLELRDAYTHGHSAEVADIVKDIMMELDLDANNRFNITFAAVLHDIGKIGISDTILNKPGRLTEEEFNLIKEHPTLGAKILEAIPALQQIKEIVKHHHERYDGGGYPDRIKGLDIELGARVIAVADSFQAMISDRPYRSGMTQAAAMQELERNKGTQFDPEIVDIFLRICKNKEYKSA